MDGTRTDADSRGILDVARCPTCGGIIPGRYALPDTLVIGIGESLFGCRCDDDGDVVLRLMREMPPPAPRDGA